MSNQRETTGEIDSDEEVTWTERSTTWYINEETSKTFAANPSNGILSPTFGEGRWQLYLHEVRNLLISVDSTDSVNLSQEDESRNGSRGISLSVQAKVDRADMRGATAEEAWVREGIWTATVKLVKDYRTSKGLKFEKKYIDFSCTNSIATIKIFGNQAELVAFCDDSHESLQVHCTLKDTSKRVSTGYPEDKTGHLFFDNPQFADVVFTFPEELAGRRIFASRAILQHRSEYFKALFSSGFSEATQAVTVDIANLLLVDEGYIEQDEDDMGMFDAGIDGEVEVYEDPKEEQHKIEEDAQKPSVPAAKPLLRSMLEVKVSDTCFVAYRAMLAYLHSGLLPLTALPSDYLIARHRALERHRSADGAFTFPSRHKWLQDRFRLPEDHPDWKGIGPCSPHAIYRLAHRYDMQDLLRLVGDRIYNGLTDENAAYELFSPLSIDHSELHDRITEYIYKNWDSVQSSYPWKLVCDKIVVGEMVHAAPAVRAVFDLMNRFSQPEKSDSDY